MKIIGKTCAALLILAAASGAPVFGADDFSYWDSTSRYPADVLNTKYHAPVKALIDAGVITGDEDGLFHPEKSITRAEFATILAKATHQQNMGGGASYFTDLEGYGWASAYINRCYEQNWIKGVGGTLFAPGKEVTYAEAITMLIRVQRGGQQEELLGKWPDVYIQYADMYNLTGTVDIMNWNAPAQKGDVALLTNRMITQPAVTQTQRSARFSGVVVAGTVGTPLTQTFSIELSNEMFIDIMPGTVVTGWFSDLGALGLTVTVKSLVSDGMSIMPLEVSGTPARALQAPLSAHIPSNYLKSGNSADVSSGTLARVDVSQP